MGVGFDIVIASLLPSYGGFFFVFGCSVSLSVGSSVLFVVVDDCLAVSCDFGVLLRRGEHVSFYSTVWFPSPKWHFKKRFFSSLRRKPLCYLGGSSYYAFSLLTRTDRGITHRSVSANFPNTGLITHLSSRNLQGVTAWWWRIWALELIDLCFQLQFCQLQVVQSWACT